MYPTNLLSPHLCSVYIKKYPAVPVHNKDFINRIIDEKNVDSIYS